MSIIFKYDEKKIIYSVVCKNTDKLAIAEDKLFEKYQDLKDEDFDYYIDSKRIKKSKTFKDANITNGSLITMQARDD